MKRSQNEFLKGLKNEDGKTSQKQIAQEAIRKQLFHRLNALDLKNGETTNLNNMAEQIADDLGLQTEINQITQYLMTLFKSGNYQFDLDDKGDIRANYSRLHILQEKEAEQSRAEVKAILQSYVDRTLAYASELESQNIRVTAVNLKHKFSLREQEFQNNWITLAIDKVLAMQNLEK